MNHLPKIIVVVIALIAYFYFNNLHHTKLPIRPQTDESVQAQLNKLNPTERELVEAYMKRSGGTPAESFSMPGQRLSASNFGEAIDEQKKFIADTGKVAAQESAADAQNDAKYNELRKAASVDVYKREILAFSLADVPLSVREDPFYKPAYPTEGATQTLVATIRLKNTSSQTITALHGKVAVYKPQYKMGEPLGKFIDCTIDLSTQLNPDETKDYACVSQFSHNYLSDRDKEFAAASPSDYIVNWRPSQITFANGTSVGVPL